jgi:lysozyme family protein
MTEDQLVADVFVREGETYADEHSTPPIDQPTAPGGIILATLSAYLGRPATLAELQALTKETATPIVRWVLHQFMARYGLTAITYEPLRLQMIDFAYNSGPERAIRWLQRVLQVEVTGRMDAQTIWAVQHEKGFLVHHALIAARLQMIDMWTDLEVRRRAWEEGLESRTLSFSLLLKVGTA